MYRWTSHRVVDGDGNDTITLAAHSMWWLARAAAEETLQGAPLVAAWLKLFRNHLSGNDGYWLRWRDDMAESAELRRAYSGLYGRFAARAMLSSQLGFSRFLSLKRNGLHVPGSVTVQRDSGGDIPDWLAWDDRSSRFVLCEAKGSLCANDFLNKTKEPRCVVAGKKQFDRVVTSHGTRIIHPAQWVAASKWATEHRGGRPQTILWDPPVEDEPFSSDEADMHRQSMSLAWLNSIATGFGARSAEELLSAERRRFSFVVDAPPGRRDGPQWAMGRDDDRLSGDSIRRILDRGTSPVLSGASQRQLPGTLALPGSLSGFLENLLTVTGGSLTPKPPEEGAHEDAYMLAAITPLGVRPVRTAEEFSQLKREQESARRLEEPAMIVGIPTGFDSKRRITGKVWLDDAGMARQDDLAVFDLRYTEVREDRALI